MKDSQAIVPGSSGNPAALALLVGRQSCSPGLPHDREIVLLSCDVRGTTHVRDIAEVEPSLHSGMRLACVREPCNVADPLAIRLETEGQRKVGYVPRAHNEVIARLMDAGKIVFARIDTNAWVGGWLKISIDVVLHDL